MTKKELPALIIIMMVLAAAVIAGRFLSRAGNASPRAVPAASRHEIPGRIPGGGVPPESSEEKKDSRCVIAGISFNKTNPLAVVENNAYVPGDPVCGGIITRINRERVTVKFPKVEKTFLIGERIAE